jgi:hypothetical protein
MYNVTLRRFANYYWREKAINITDGSVCACAYVRIALLIQHATRMRHVVTSFVAPSISTPFFDIISYTVRFSQKRY